jgi:hypothetical protein
MDRQSLTDEELCFWLGYISQPEKWHKITAWRRLVAGQIVNKNRRLPKVLMGLIVLLLLARASALIAGIPIQGADLLTGIVIGVLIMLILITS